MTLETASKRCSRACNCDLEALGVCSDRSQKMQETLQRTALATQPFSSSQQSSPSLHQRALLAAVR